MALIPTSTSIVQSFAGALYGVQIGTVTMAAVNRDIDNLGLNPTLNAYFSYSFGTLTAAQVADRVVTNLGITTGKDNAVAYVVGQLGSKAPAVWGETIASILAAFSSLTADATYGAAATAWNTKVEAAAAYTGATDVAVGTVVSTFTLTTSADTVNGTAYADTFNANIGSAAGVTTATTGDILNGGAGADTLNLTAVDAANPGLLQTSNLENINIRLLGTVTADALLMSGYENFVSNGSSAALTVNNAAIAATHGVKNSISGNAADLSVNFRGAEVAGTADVAKISLENTGSSVIAAGASSPTVTRVTVNVGAGAESIALTTAGTNYNTVNGQTTTTTLTVAGNGTNNITVGTMKATSTIDASASTGTNTFNLGSAVSTGDVVTGGSGADTVTMTATNAATVTMSGVESLQIDGGTAVTTFSANPALTNLNIRSASDAITVAGLTTLSNLNYQGDATAGYAGGFGSVTMNTALPGTADSVAIAIGNQGKTANGSYNAGTLTTSGVENLTITQSDMLATGTTTMTIQDTGLKTLAVTSAGSLALTLGTKASNAPATSSLYSSTTSTTGSNSVTSVDLSGVAGSSSSITFEAGTFATGATVKAAVGGSTFVLDTETAADAITFTGGAGVDSFTTGTTGTFTATLGGGATNTFDGSLLAAAAAGNTANVTGGDGADTIKGGANADTIVGGAGNDAITGGKGADVIDGGLGADTYNFSLGAAASNATGETQTITVTHGTTGGTTSAQNLVVTVLGTSVNVVLPADAGGGQTPTTEAASIATALNSIAAGRFVATSLNGVVTVTYATALGDVAGLTMKADVNATASGTAVANTTTANSDVSTYTIATSTAGVNAVAAQASDSNVTTMDSLTYVTAADVIHVTTQAGVAVTMAKATATAASAGNYGAVAATGLYTLDATHDTSFDATVAGVAANITAGVTAAGEVVGFVYGGQAYLYVSDGVNGYSANGDLVIKLAGVSTLATGITIASGDITAIA